MHAAHSSRRISHRCAPVLAFLFLCHAHGSDKEEARGWLSEGNRAYKQALPVDKFSATENVIWKTPLPSWGNSTPIVVDGRIYLTAEKEKIICVDAGSSKIVWQKDVPYLESLPPELRKEAEKELPAAQARTDEYHRLARKRMDLAARLSSLPGGSKSPEYARIRKEVDELKARCSKLSAMSRSPGKWARPGCHHKNGYSSPTPVVCGGRVHAVFGSGMAATYDIEGRKLWVRGLARPKHRNRHGYCSSPAMADGKLIIEYGNLLHALDPASGKEIWKATCASTNASPRVIPLGDGTEAIVSSGGDLFDARDGSKQPRCIRETKRNKPLECTVTNAGNVIYVMGSTLWAQSFRLERKNGGIQGIKLWDQIYEAKRNDHFYSTPVLHQGLLYNVSGHGYFCILDAGTGKRLYTNGKKKLNWGRPYWLSSPLAADNRLLFANGSRNGTQSFLLVLQPGKEYKELTRSKIDESFYSSPVLAGGRLYLRTWKHLYCFGRK